MTMPPVAVLAGGLASRMLPLTQAVPKSLLLVAGEPFIFHQLRLLRRQGIGRVVLCIGHLGEQIHQQVGDGAALGLAVDYASDGATLLGTGGALRQALPLLGDRFWVLYGDSYLELELAPVLQCFEAAARPALMTVLRNDNLWGRSNAVYAAGLVSHYDKRAPLPAMHHIDYGLSLFRASAFANHPAGAAFDLASLQHDLAAAGALAGFEVTQRFHEVGSPAGLAALRAHLGGTDAG